jgi:hypothetical protein
MPDTPPDSGVFDVGTSLAFFGPVDHWDINENGIAIFNGHLDVNERNSLAFESTATDTDVILGDVRVASGRIIAARSR